MNTLAQIANNKSQIIKKDTKLIGFCPNHRYYMPNNDLEMCKNCGSFVCWVCITLNKNKCIVCCDKREKESKYCTICNFAIDDALCKKCGIYIAYCIDGCKRFSSNAKGRVVKLSTKSYIHIYCKSCFDEINKN